MTDFCRFIGTVAEYNDLAQLLPMAETFEPAVPGTVIEPIMIKVQDMKVDDKC